AKPLSQLATESPLVENLATVTNAMNHAGDRISNVVGKHHVLPYLLYLSPRRDARQVRLEVLVDRLLDVTALERNSLECRQLVCRGAGLGDGSDAHVIEPGDLVKLMVRECDIPEVQPPHAEARGLRRYLKLDLDQRSNVRQFGKRGHTRAK